MAGQKHIGLVVFAICSALSARIAIFEPKPRVLTAAEERWGSVQKEEDPMGFIHGVRFYIYGIGVIGLLLIVEDHLTQELSRKKAKSHEVSETNERE